MHTSSIAKQRHRGDCKASEIIKCVTLAPGEGERVLLGIYEKGMCKPRFDLKIDPATSDDVKSELIKLEEKDGGYKLVYYLQNFSPQTCHVEIQERWVEHA